MSNITTAISTYKTYLMVKNNGTYEKLIDIKDFPDLGGTPDTLDTTTLSDHMRTSILGIQELDVLEFTANYTVDNYKKVLSYVGTEHELAVWFGGDNSIPATPTGEQGMFEFTGELSAFPTGGGVNTVVDLKISIAATSVIVFVDPSTTP